MAKPGSPFFLGWESWKFLFPLLWYKGQMLSSQPPRGRTIVCPTRCAEGKPGGGGDGRMSEKALAEFDG